MLKRDSEGKRTKYYRLVKRVACEIFWQFRQIQCTFDRVLPIWMRNYLPFSDYAVSFGGMKKIRYALHGEWRPSNPHVASLNFFHVVVLKYSCSCTQSFVSLHSNFYVVTHKLLCRFTQIVSPYISMSCLQNTSSNSCNVGPLLHLQSPFGCLCKRKTWACSEFIILTTFHASWFVHNRIL